MTTMKFTGQDLSVGQWVNLDTMLVIGFAGRVARIVDVKQKSVVVVEARRIRRTGDVEMGAPLTKRMTSISFVSDTMEEAEAMLAASLAFIDSELAIERNLKAAATSRKYDAISAALRASAPSVESPAA